MGYSNPNIKEIIENFLKKNGYDGLYNTEDECGCEVGDLFPCGNPSEIYCRAGYRQPCYSCDNNCDFHIGPRKECLMVIIEDENLDIWWECSYCSHRFKDDNKFEKNQKCPNCDSYIIGWNDYLGDDQ